MFELSEERLENDELELHHYGFSSTQIYVHFRESINKRLKMLMLDLSDFLRDIQTQDPDAINERLFGQYKDFWAAAEPSLQKFYEEIQSILAIPKNFVPKGFTSRPKDIEFCESEVVKIEKRIENLEYQYMSEKYYLHALKQRKKVIEKTCIPLKKQIDLAAKLLKENMQKMEHFDVLDNKRVEKMEKYQEGLKKYSLLECMRDGEKSDVKAEENLKHFIEIIEEDKNKGT